MWHSAIFFIQVARNRVTFLKEQQCREIEVSNRMNKRAQKRTRDKTEIAHHAD